jgi:serine/threonine-protein kinase
MDAVEEDRLPRRFGKYSLFDKIGEGGMARIYLGRTKTDLGGERLVVVKQILPILSSSAEFSRLLIDEAKLAARLSQGNIVQVFDLGREDDALYIAMEYIEGFDLRQLLLYCSRTGVPLPVEFALLVVTETLFALDYAHRKRDEDGTPLEIVHRDVSPSNVLLSFDGEVKLCDFGIARAMGASEALPEEAIQGKTGYMSPEAARGEPLDARSDLFSVGIMLWELLAGRRMYGKRPTLEQAQAAEIPDLPDRSYPEQAELFGIVMRALKKDRTQRYESAREMLHALEGYARRTHLTASPLRFGEWLVEHFGAQILEWRKARERAARALELGPAIELQTLATPEPPPPEFSETDLPVPEARSDALAAPPPDAANGRKPAATKAPAQAPAAIWLVIGVLVAAIALVAYFLR